MPMTPGGPERAATILFGSFRETTAKANTPGEFFDGLSEGVLQLP
jgi:hypothetical protein